MGSLFALMILDPKRSNLTVNANYELIPSEITKIKNFLSLSILRELLIMNNVDASPIMVANLSKWHDWKS